MPKQEVLVAYLQEFLVDFHQGAGSWLSYGLRGLLVSPGKGLLITTPPVILAGLGFVPFFRRYRAEALAVVGLFLTLVLFYSTRRGWHGGACWGPRYLLPAMPLLMLPVGAAFDIIGRQIGPRACCLRAACWIVFVVGLLVQVAAVSVSPLNYYETIYRRGIISEASLDGGPAYLREIYFDPRYSPVWGQAQLAVQRSLALARGTLGSARPLPNTSAELNEYFATEETLDFWWIHLLRQTSHRGGDLP